MTGPRAAAHAAIVALLAIASGVSAGCAWKEYVVTRGIRHVTGSPTRFHPIVPLTASLKPYRIVEVAPLESLLGEAMPTRTERYLAARIVDGLRTLPTSPQVVAITTNPFAPAAQAAADPPAWSAPTLRVEGLIDDLDAGSLPLRVVELGFNHVTVTVRIRLRDKATSQLVGAASFTAQDDRVTATANRAIDNLAKRIHAYVGSGYER